MTEKQVLFILDRLMAYHGELDVKSLIIDCYKNEKLFRKDQDEIKQAFKEAFDKGYISSPIPDFNLGGR